MSQQLICTLPKPDQTHNPFFLSEHRQVRFHIAKLWHHNNVTGHMKMMNPDQQ